MKAAVYRGTEDVRIQDVDAPVCGDDDVVLRVQACGICGTDVHTYRHGSVFASAGQILGHEFSGVVCEVGSEVSGVRAGDRVTAWPIVPCDRCASCRDGSWHLCENALGQSISSGVPGGFAEYVRVPHARVGRTLYALPDELSWIGGALVEPMSVALRAAGFCAVGPTDTALVTGLGPIGLGVVQALKLRGAARVIGVDPAARRRSAGLAVGADEVVDRHSGRVDVVCECSGTGAALHDAVEAVKPGGRVVLVGLHGRRLEIDLDRLLIKEIAVHGVYAYRDEYRSAIALLASGRLRIDPLVSHTYHLDDIALAFATQADPNASVKVVVTA